MLPQGVKNVREMFKSVTYQLVYEEKAGGLAESAIRAALAQCHEVGSQSLKYNKYALDYSLHNHYGAISKYMSRYLLRCAV